MCPASGFLLGVIELLFAGFSSETYRCVPTPGELWRVYTRLGRAIDRRDRSRDRSPRVNTVLLLYDGDDDVNSSFQ